MSKQNKKNSSKRVFVRFIIILSIFLSLIFIYFWKFAILPHQCYSIYYLKYRLMHNKIYLINSISCFLFYYKSSKDIKYLDKSYQIATKCIKENKYPACYVVLADVCNEYKKAMINRCEPVYYLREAEKFFKDFTGKMSICDKYIEVKSRENAERVCGFVFDNYKKYIELNPDSKELVEEWANELKEKYKRYNQTLENYEQTE